MTAITTAQLDELERYVADGVVGEINPGHIIRLVAIARAALAWNETRKALVEAHDDHEYRGDSESLAAVRIARDAHDVTDLVKAIEAP